MRLPIGIEVNRPGEYYLAFDTIIDFSYGTSLYLVDTYEGTLVPVSSVQDYPIIIKDISKPLNDRFYLSLNTEIKWDPERRNGYNKLSGRNVYIETENQQRDGFEKDCKVWLKELVLGLS